MIRKSARRTNPIRVRTVLTALLCAASCLAVAAVIRMPAVAPAGQSAVLPRMVHGEPASLAAASASPCLTRTTINLATYPGLYRDGSHADANELVLQNLFNTVQPCTTILMPRGAVYAHSRELVLSQSDVTIAPAGTGSDPQLLSTDVYTAGDTCQIWKGFPRPCLVFLIRGARDNISDLVVANQSHSLAPGVSPPTEHGIVLSGDGQTLSNVSVWTPAYAGIETEGATNLTLDHPIIVNSGMGITYAGGASLIFHSGSTGPTGNVFVQSPTVVNSGDDGICVESYIGSGSIQHDIWVNNYAYINSPTTSYGAHGIAIVGGDRITLTNFVIENSPSAGIYIGSGTAFNDAGSNTVAINGGLLYDVNTAASATTGRVVQGALQVVPGSTASDGAINNVTVDGINFTNTNPAADRQVGDFPNPNVSPAPPSATNVTFKNFTFTGTEPATLFKYLTTPPRDITTVGWKIVNADGTTTALQDHPPGPVPEFP